MMLALSYFTTKTWTFENSNFLGLIDKIPEADREQFDYDFQNLNYEDFFKNASIGCQKYIFKVDIKNLSFAKQQLNR